MSAASTSRKTTPGRCLFYEEARARWLRPVSEGLLRLTSHASATRALLRTGDGALAPGAAHVSAIVALRSAATASGSHVEFTGKWHALATFGRVVPPTFRRRFARLCEAARQVEVGRRLAEGLPVDPSGLAPGPRPIQVARRVDPVAVELYADVLWLGGQLDRVRSLLADVEAEADELDRCGPTAVREGVDAYLCDVALGLCLRPPAAASEAVDHAGLLAALRPAARGRPAVEAMIEVALAIDKATWGRSASQRAPGKVSW